MVTFLTPELLDAGEFRRYSQLQKTLLYEPGWHYALDVVWVIRQIRSVLVPPATVLDVGAGSGPLQFVLASYGYNVLSVDLLRRDPSGFHRAYFKVHDRQAAEVESDYTQHLRARTAPFHFRFYTALRRRIRRGLVRGSSRASRLADRREEHGSISLYASDITRDRELLARADAVVSVSALEHIPSIDQFQSVMDAVLATNSPIAISTSAARATTWWHKPSRGWCFGPQLLRRYGNTNDWQGRYDQALSSLSASRYLRSHVPIYYRHNPNCGLPYGIWSPKYVPVGISGP